MMEFWSWAESSQVDQVGACVPNENEESSESLLCWATEGGMVGNVERSVSVQRFWH